MKKYISLFPVCLFTFIIACNSNSNTKNIQTATADTIIDHTIITRVYSEHLGMVPIPAGKSQMGSDLANADANEKPIHEVYISAFWMDATEVTNAQFEKFVNATHYITTAEKIPNWEEMKKQLPPGTPKPNAEDLVPAGLVFYQPSSIQGYTDYSQWWKWVAGANWRHPLGPNSNIKGKENEPVVQISWDDACAYAKWAHKRLPTEAEWEWAARGGLKNKIYAWGNDHPDANQTYMANIWQGEFPMKDLGSDGFKGISPVKSFAANGYGLYDMAGNVWEWTHDWYHEDYYAACAKFGTLQNPQGAISAFDANEPFAPKKVIRGGSFLCNDVYCSGFRVSRRMQSTFDTGTNHIGFRCVSDVK